MSDKKLTDSEIVKAFKICNSLEDGYCSNCPYEYCDRCIRAVATDTLDLINRLQKENKRLKKENRQFADIGKMYSEAKADAYKECIDMVKKKGVKVGVDEICIFECTLDNLLKERVGE